MSARPSKRRVEQTLRRVAQLRTLFHRLPHLPSPRERAQLAEFEMFVAGSRSRCSFDALHSGFRDAHRRGDACTIRTAAERAGEWVRSDPILHPYYYWAQQGLRDSAVASLASESPRE